LSHTIDNLAVDTSDKLNASKFVIDRILDFEITDDLNARIAAIEDGNSDEPGE
jgi:hypothetical protein